MKTSIRTLDIFETFAAVKRPLTLTELAAELSTPVSSCFGLVRALESKGYLHPYGDRKELYPTRRMLRNVQIIGEHEPVLPRIAPVLQSLRDATRETIILGQLHASGASVVYLDVIEGPQTVRYAARIGDLKALHASSIGKVLLADMPHGRFEAIIRKAGLEPVTSATLVSVDALRADLALGRERGYQMTRGENVADVAAIAAGVAVAGRNYGVAIAGPLARMDAALSRHAEALRIAVAEIERSE
jgi:DNA-binding IclR family transcriptional regulator